MALPLILAAGAGILSGGRYLMNKSDQRQAQENVGQLQNFLQTSNTAAQRPDVAQGFLNMAQKHTDGGSIFDKMGAGRETQSLFDLAQQYELGLNTQNIQAQQAQALQQAQMQDPFSDENREIGNFLLNEYQSALQVHRTMQDNFQAGMNALNDPSNLNSKVAVYNMMNIIDPGAIVTESDAGLFKGAGDAGNKWANILNEMTGEGLSDATRREIEASLWSQFEPRLNSAKKQRDFYEGRINDLRASGRNVQSPAGSLGLDFDIQRQGIRGQPRGTQAPAPPRRAPPQATARPTNNNTLVQEAIDSGIPEDVARRLVREGQ